MTTARRVAALGVMCCLLAIASVLAPGSAGATPLEVQFVSSPTGTALVDQYGTSYPVTVKVQPERRVVEDGRAMLARTVVLSARLPGDDLSGVATTADTAGGCESDGSYSVRACLTQFYTRSGTYVAVQRYTASWFRSSSQAVLSQGTILASVLGRCRAGSGCSSLSDTKSKVVPSPASGAEYHFYPPWNGIFVEVNNVRYQCGNSTLNWRRGTGSYTFRHTNVCQGNIP